VDQSNPAVRVDENEKEEVRLLRERLQQVQLRIGCSAREQVRRIVETKNLETDEEQEMRLLAEENEGLGVQIRELREILCMEDETGARTEPEREWTEKDCLSPEQTCELREMQECTCDTGPVKMYVGAEFYSSLWNECQELFYKLPDNLRGDAMTGMVSILTDMIAEMGK